MVVVIRQPPNMITETHHTVTSSPLTSITLMDWGSWQHDYRNPIYRYKQQVQFVREHNKHLEDSQHYKGPSIDTTAQLRIHILSRISDVSKSPVQSSWSFYTSWYAVCTTVPSPVFIILHSDMLTSRYIYSTTHQFGLNIFMSKDMLTACHLSI